MRPAGILIHTTAERFPAMRDFYRRLFGEHQKTDRPLFVNFAWEGFRITVTTHSELSGPATEPPRLMINLAVDSIATALAMVPDAPLVRPRESEPWGGWVATIADPDGNYLQFMELPGE